MLFYPSIECHLQFLASAQLEEMGPNLRQRDPLRVFQLYENIALQTGFLSGCLAPLKAATSSSYKHLLSTTRAPE